MTISIVGFSSTDKVPGGYGETVFGSGAVSAASIPLILLLVGTMGVGTATANQDFVPIRSTNDADASFQAGFPIARMCYEALKIDGVTIIAAPIPEAGGAVAATATITIDSTWSTSGTWGYRLDGQLYTGGIASVDDKLAVALAIRDAFNADPTAPVTAAVGAGGSANIVTLTTKGKSIYENDHSLYQDKTQLPVGATSVIAGGTAMSGGGVHFVSGAGAPDVTTLLTAELVGTYDRIGVQTNDATNLTRWRAQLAAKAGPLEGRLEHLVAATTGTLASAVTLATGQNDQRQELLWYLNGECHPSQLAAVFAAMRCAKEQNNPNQAYDGDILPGFLSQAAKGDVPSHSTLQSALNNGITPITSTAGKKAAIVRSITTHSLSGSNPDYSTLNTYDAVVPDFVRKDVLLFWATDFKIANPYVDPNPAESEREPPAGVAYPDLWNSQIVTLLRGYEADNIVDQVTTHLPSTEYDNIAKRLMSVIPALAKAHQHQVGISVRQQNA